MRRVLLPLIATLISGATLASSPARQGSTVRVLTYNIHHGEGMDGRVDLDRLAGVIVGTRPDIVALQEVDRGAARTAGVDQAAELARLTGLGMEFGQTIPLQGGQYGNVVLSRWSIRRAANHPLPNPAGGEARAALEVEVVTPTGEAITVLATHLHHTSDEANRIAQAEALLAQFPAGADSGSRDAPMLLIGDLNATPESRPITLLLTSWFATSAADLAPTSPAEDPRRKIDYVLYRPGGRWRVVESRVIVEPVASDHRPVLAVLELRPAPDRR